MTAQPALMVVADAKAPEPPYARTTLSKGWRFELDSERIRRSDTWALTPPELRPWLLMLWMTAWDQAPCGSLPANDELIAAHTGMDLRQFRANRDLLMRGWWLASDGRLYHDVITEQVLALIALREEEAARKQRYREKLAHAKNQQPTKNVPRDTHGTPVGATPPEPEPEPEPEPKTLKPKTAPTTTTDEGERAPQRTPLVALVCLLREHGADVTPANPQLAEWLERRVTDEQALAALAEAKRCREKQQSRAPIGAAYLTQILRTQLAAPKARAESTRERIDRERREVYRQLGSGIHGQPDEAEPIIGNAERLD